MYWWLFLFCPIAYLISGLNFSKLVARLKGVDLAQVGSGNSGATNIGRALGFWHFCLVIVLELLKSASVMLMGYLYCSLRLGDFMFTETHYLVMAAIGLSAIIGSIFPVWYRFQGGKGIAVWIGMGFFLNPIVMLIDAAIYIPLLLLTRVMSISTLLGVITWAVLSFTTVSGIFQVPLTWPLAILYALCTLLLLFSHRKNIYRIFTGQEKRISFKKKTTEQK